jgi:hypothetical protein
MWRLESGYIREASSYYGWTRSRIQPETPRGETNGLDSGCSQPISTMVPKLSSRQQAQLAYLELLVPKLQRIYSLVEQMASARVDEAILRGLGRLLDEIKGNAAALSLGGLAETAGRMGMLVRGSGGLPLKVRGLREMQSSLKMNYDAALRSATTPEGEVAE